MSNSILPDIYRRLQISKSESLILQTIAAKANVQGANARIAYPALAASVDLTERWTKELVRRLEARQLLRVSRAWLAPGLCSVNVYTVVRPWLREISYREALSRRTAQPTTRASSEASVHGKPTMKIHPKSSGACSHELCLKAGLTEGSFAYRAARGLDPP